MYITAFKFFVLTLTTLLLVCCADKNAALESEEKLLDGINKATESFDKRPYLVSARSLIMSSVHRGLTEPDSLVLVESINELGEYQCVSYTFHNKMITFYNARKVENSSGQFTGKYVQVPTKITPNEALTFIDAYQNGSFEKFYEDRNKNQIENIEKKWIISFITCNARDYSFKCMISQ